MGCRMLTEVWQVAGWNVLQERKKDRQGQSVGRRMDIGKSEPMRKRNIDVSQTVSDRERDKQSLWMGEPKQHTQSCRDKITATMITFQSSRETVLQCFGDL